MSHSVVLAPKPRAFVMSILVGKACVQLAKSGVPNLQWSDRRSIIRGSEDRNVRLFNLDHRDARNPWPDLKKSFVAVAMVLIPWDIVVPAS